MNFIVWFIIHQMFIKNAHLGFIPCMLLFGFFCFTLIVEILIWSYIVIKKLKIITKFFEEHIPS